MERGAAEATKKTTWCVKRGQRARHAQSHVPQRVSRQCREKHTGVRSSRQPGGGAAGVGNHERKHRVQPGSLRIRRAKAIATVNSAPSRPNGMTLPGTKAQHEPMHTESVAQQDASTDGKPPVILVSAASAFGRHEAKSQALCSPSPQGQEPRSPTTVRDDATTDAPAWACPDAETTML